MPHPRSVVPAQRIRQLNQSAIRHDGEWVLYWMTAHRRSTSNFALQRAVEWANELAKPLFVFEPLRLTYPWASDRLHRFILDGIADNRDAFRRPGVTYFPYVETPGHPDGLIDLLASKSAAVVCDDFPAFIVNRITEAAAARVNVLTEAVDANGILPMRTPEQEFSTAVSFRRYLQRTLLESFPIRPAAAPLAALRQTAGAAVPAEVSRVWLSRTDELISGAQGLDTLPIDHRVASLKARGGSRAAHAALRRFLKTGLSRYADEHNAAESDVTSRLSPYLHFGHIGSWEIFDALMKGESWLGVLPARATGARQGWWGVSPGAEAFLDQLITWRELGFNTCVRRPDDYDRFESLPAWARATLLRHVTDRRSITYSLEQFEGAATDDSLWNAAQGQLIAEGRIHNYLRMLWGKKILEWTPSPHDALAVMIELNNKYAADGRDPNSYSGIFWTLGRYDRPWPPERPIFGTVRYMSSKNTARKMPVKEYVRRYAPDRHRERPIPDY